MFSVVAMRSCHSVEGSSKSRHLNAILPLVKPPKRPFWDRVHDSPFLAGEPLIASRTTLRLCWWWLVGCPLLSLLLAFESRNAGSADEAIPFHFIPLFLLSLMLAPMVIFRGRRSDVSPAQRRLHLWLGLAIVPMFVLLMLLDGFLGWHSRDAFGWEEVFVLVALVAWLVAMWTVRPRVLRI
jgi:hypothetical protein